MGTRALNSNENEIVSPEDTETTDLADELAAFTVACLPLLFEAGAAFAVVLVLDFFAGGVGLCGAIER
jgi:hypothetical protein